jgi:predicted amidohydrolase
MAFDLKVAAVQLTSTADKEANLERAERLIREAVEQGAEFVVLPELFNCLAHFPTVIANAEPIPGPTSERMSRVARELKIYLCAGSICEHATQTHGYNTALFFSPDGELLTTYRKIHLFDIRLAGRVEISESAAMLAGDQVALVAHRNVTYGMATCYDLRFPELFRALADRQVEIICFPSAFTRETGRAHWHTLLRARAIENQCYVVAANQVGRHTPRLESYGHSMIVDAWGNVLAEADGENESVIVAQIRSTDLVKIREALPALSHRKVFRA